MAERLTNQKLRSFYDADYVNQYHRKDTGRISKVLSKIELRSTDDVVDYACGNGLLLKEVHDKVRSYNGVDFSEKFIEAANKNKLKLKAKNARYHCMDIIEFSKVNECKFDFAFTLDFSEHIYDDDFLAIYSAIRESLKPGGRLVLHTPNLDFFLELLKVAGVMRQFPEHVSVRSEKQYRKLLGSCGYQNITVSYLPHYVKILKPLHILSLIPIIGRYFKARILITCEK